MEESSSPRRFRFGLRTLFVLVTVAAMVSAWVGYSLNWIRQRHALINATYAPSTIAPSTIEEGWLISPPAPCGLWLFGEPGTGVLWVDAQDAERARKLFPEGEIFVNTFN